MAAQLLAMGHGLDIHHWTAARLKQYHQHAQVHPAEGEVL